MPATRSPILGYNHNFKHRGLVFHVQTEDSGVDNPHIFTHLFHGGVIISTRKLEYDKESEEDVVKALMQAQHKAVLKDLKSGVFREKINSYLGDNPDLEPAPDVPQPVSSELTEPQPSVPHAVPEDDNTVPSEVPNMGGAFEPTYQDTSPIPIEEVDEPKIPLGDPVVTFSKPSGKNKAPTPTPGEVSAAFNAVVPPEDLNPKADEGAPTEPMRHESSGRYSQSRAASDRIPPTPPIEPSRRRARRDSSRRAGNVVVSRPAVIVGGPPKVVDGSGKRKQPAARRAREGSNIFGGDLISEKSLDEVILAYLSDETGEE